MVRITVQVEIDGVLVNRDVTDVELSAYRSFKQGLDGWDPANFIGSMISVLIGSGIDGFDFGEVRQMLDDAAHETMAQRCDHELRPVMWQCGDCSGDVELGPDGTWLNSWCVCDGGPKALQCRHCGEEQVQ